MALSYSKGKLIVAVDIPLIQTIKITEIKESYLVKKVLQVENIASQEDMACGNSHEVWSEVVNQSTECQTIAPRCGHILHLHAWVALSDSFAPDF